MKFGIAFKFDEPAVKQLPLLSTLLLDIKQYFSERDYGESVRDYALLIVAYGSRGTYKVNSPTYVEHKMTKNRFTGITMEMNKLFMNEIKIDESEYQQFVKGEEEDSQKLIARVTLRSLSNLDSLPKKVKDFDKQRFISDMEEFFRQRGLV
jgi:hypothetical protein